MRTPSRLLLLVAVALLMCCAVTRNQTVPERRRAPAASQAREGLRKVRDTRLFVREVGPELAPVLVVVHGGPGGNHNSLRPLERLAPGHRVVLYDQRGTGRSDRLDVSAAQPASLRQLRLEQNVEDLEALRRLLGRERISLIGHSWGAALAVFYAAAYPQRVERLIVYSGGPETRDLARRKSAAHNERLTADEQARFKQLVGLLLAAVKRGAPQDELDRRFGDLAGVMFAALNCKRPAASTHADVGRAGFWANQAAGQYTETFDYAAIAAQLRAIRAPTLLTWGRCEPSPMSRLTNLLDYLPAARFVIFEDSGHNAMEEQPRLFFDTIRAFLAGRPLPVAAHASRDALSAALLARQREQLDRWGDRLTDWLYAGRTAELFARFSPQLQAALPQDKLDAFRDGLRAQLGAEQQVLHKVHSLMPTASVYRRVVRFERSAAPQQIAWTLTALDGERPIIAGLTVLAPAKPAPSARLAYQTKTALRLPVAGTWLVAWGGRSVAQNYHAAARDQRFAYDLLVVKDGSTHDGDGSQNEQYHCFGRPVLAAGAGAVVAAEDGHDDRPPGKLVDEQPLGNHVIIDHGQGEFSFSCHLRKGSLRVKRGDTVAAGQPIGACGNSGRSSEPHLHFHLQDTARPFKGAGVPAQFAGYQANGREVARGEPVQGELVAGAAATAPAQR